MRWHPAVAAVIFLQVLSIYASPASSYPKLEYYVTDQVGVLTVNDIYQIEDLCLEVDSGTGCEIAVLIVNTTQPDGMDLFAVKTFE
ncbi:MAG: TPM domain-containing protein, partial [Candidatus Thermoplasmatota archaeon]|nr:TPM domain-containing protein [Candidatus Thermoplasmatota archaeon]